MATAGSAMVMNQDPARRGAMREAMSKHYARLDACLQERAPAGTFMFDTFGWAEAVFTPLFMRFRFLDCYEGFDLPDEPGVAQVRGWRDARLGDPAAQQIAREEIVKRYCDYAGGAGNGAPPPGRGGSSFLFEPRWSARPWPPRDEYGTCATDAEPGL